MRDKRKLVSIIALVLAAVMLLGLLIGMIPTHAHAAKLTSAKLESLKEQISELEDEQSEIQAEIDALRQQISANMSEMEKLIAEKNAIDQEVGLLNQQIAVINEQITVYGMLIADKQDELDEAKARLEKLRTENKARIRAMEEQGSLSYWAVLFKANSFSDLLDRLNMIKEIAEADQRRIAEMNRATEEVAEAQKALEEEKAVLEGAKEELNAVQEELALKRLAADEVLVKLNARGEEYSALVDAAEEEEEALHKEIAKAEIAYNKEYDRLKEEERRRKEEEERRRQEEALKQLLAQQQQQQQQGGGSSNTTLPDYTDNSTAVPSNATWLVPCTYVYLSSPYGWRIHPVYGTLGFHSGVDLAAPKGTPIVASRSGTVTKATYNSSAGYYVTVNHGDGFSTSYLHMTHYIVKVGQKVSQGQVIGYVGSTGTSTGNHLHFTVYYNGSTQNPTAYINFR